MSFISTDVWRAFAAETTKLAAPRQLREVRKLFDAGKVDEANALTRRLHDAGALKVTDQGSLVRGLGSGAEGLAETVVGATDQPGRIAVRKTYSPEVPIYSPGQENRKVRVGALLRGNPDFAEIYTQGQARQNPNKFSYMLKEYVPGTKIERSAASNAFAAQAEQAANAAAQKVNLRVRDIQTPQGGVIGSPMVANRGNTILGRDGRNKVVDFIADEQAGPFYPNSSSLAGRKGVALTPEEVHRIRKSFGRTPLPARTPAIKPPRMSSSAEATQPLTAETTPLTSFF